MPNQKQTTKIKLPVLRVIPVSFSSAVWNMAADEYLMQHSEVPVLRFYQWQKPTLSFGSSFGNSLAHRLAALKELDFQTIRDFDLDGVIRKTGGKTVLHQYELTYSFIAPNFPLGILDSYQKISTILQKAFASFSLDCQLQKKPKIVTKSLNCFQEISSYELEVNKKKLVGSAQKRQKNKMLQHGAILLDIDWQLWARLWQLNQDYLKKRITSFKEILGNIPSVTVLTEKIALEFSKSFAAKLERTDFSIAEKNSIEKLCPSYYFDDFYSLKNEQPNKKKRATS